MLNYQSRIDRKSKMRVAATYFLT
ncbi:hypothetical protein DWY35_11365 [Ruminococcus sp. AF25-13]|nr:hypothetical protein DXD07_04120 [Ruminococcus sp. TF10-6]RGF29657.1 hypothetical protein DW106_03580 [Ruminococcus sp. AM09-18-1]RGG27667.1 hypothetical protein DWY35_11365 [Ruminococcus sp. AF25-13]RGG36788.1 hypothetical protein DWY13_10245 [Ruminococcus sp. AF24-16]RGI17279.1 hypothetical protein DXD00_03110 [Ruminococcus sp. TF10-12AC]